MNKKIIISVLCLILAAFSIVSLISASAGSFVEYNDWKLEIPSMTNKTEYYIGGYNGDDSNLVIPDRILDRTVVKINEYAFASNENLMYCTIPDTIVEIDNYAFDNCSELRGITIPASVAKMGKGAFYGCSSIVDLNIEPKSQLDEVSYVAFANCSSMLTATVGQGVGSIADYAFGNCSNLRYITIYPSVTEIGINAFYGCDNLTIRGYSGSYAIEYAIANNIPYKNLGVYVEPTEPTTAPTTATEPSEVVSSVVTEPTEVSTPDEPTTPVTTPSTTVTEPTEESSATASEPTETTVVMKLLYFMGDADLDYRVTIKDATKIQKHLAKISELNEIQLILADVDENSSVSVKDATKIQKFLAGFADISVVGSEVYL